MAAGMTAEELAVRAGTSTERVHEMTRLGIIAAVGGLYDDDDVGRAVVVEALSGGGVSLTDLAVAVESGKLSLGWFGGILPPVPSVGTRTVLEAIQEAGVPPRVIEQLFAFWGVATPPLDATVREDDALIIDHVGRAFAAFGRDERLLLSSARYFGDNIRRMAQSQMDFFRREIMDPLLASGASLREVIETANPFIADIVRPAVRDLLLWLYRRHIDTLNTQLLVQLVEATLQESGVKTPDPVRPPTIAFLDLSGFTRISDEAGDDEAVRLATALTDLVRTVPIGFGGTPVKLLGDGVMLHFGDSPAAVRCTVHLVAEVERRGLPPARVGVHTGPVVFRDGDYFGRTVNVAARITDYARPREVLVSDVVRRALQNEDRIAVEEIGSVALKGVSEPVRLFSVRDGTRRDGADS
jgi:adenylate cyclase